MSDFKDFDLDLSKSEGNGGAEPNTIITPVLSWYTNNYCTNTSTHCSPSDATMCRNVEDSGKGALLNKT